MSKFQVNFKVFLDSVSKTKSKKKERRKNQNKPLYCFFFRHYRNRFPKAMLIICVWHNEQKKNKETKCCQLDDDDSASKIMLNYVGFSMIAKLPPEDSHN